MAIPRRALVLVPVVLVVAVVATRVLRSRSARDPDEVRVAGNIEVTDAGVGFRIAGHLRERLVSEGETVTAGQVVARLESRELELECSLRRAEVAGAEAALAEAEAGSRPEEVAAARATAQAAQAQVADLQAGARTQELAAAQAAVEGALADERHARTELERARTLRDARVTTPQEFDRAQVEHDRSVARLTQAQESLGLLQAGPRPDQLAQASARLDEARERAELVRLGPRAEAIAQARARLEQARAALALAETHLGYATLTSPLAGVVLADHIEAGEYVAPGTPVITVGDVRNAWLRAYLGEQDLGRVRLGQSVEVSTDTYPGKVYTGTLSFIAAEAEFTPRSVQTQKERVRLVYRVKIDVANPDLELKPGMPADARIRLAESAERGARSTEQGTRGREPGPPHGAASSVAHRQADSAGQGERP